MNGMIKRSLFVVCCALAVSGSAAVKPGLLFTDNMVLQREKPVVIWGTAESGEKVSVRFAGQTKSAVTDVSNHWKITLDPMPASSKPRKLQVSGFEFQVSFSDVLVGEVWFAGGQSNMRFALWSSDGAAELFQSGGADIPGLRLFAMPEIINELDAELPIKGWQTCTKDNATAFSAVAWYFGRDLKAALGDVPVGLIMSARGGTPAEAWMDPTFAADCKPFTDYAESIDAAYRAKFANFEDYKAAYIEYRKDWQAFIHKKSTKNPVEPKGPYFGQRAGGLYATMIAPILPYSVRGALWYQGESNAWHAYDYRTVLETLIRNWRRDFNDPVLPFLVVQLPGFGCGNAEHPIWAVVRDSQTAVAEADPNVGVIPIPELGDETDIHPKNKRPVGSRIARYALGQVYGNDIQFAGPSLNSVQFSGGEARVVLKDAEGLVQRGEVIHGFTVAGVDEKFVPATAVLKKGHLVISSPNVKNPVAVRYHWSNWIDSSEVNLFNGAELPLAPFRTDDFKVVTQK
jgi:sialate O-acetylesterase